MSQLNKFLLASSIALIGLGAGSIAQAEHHVDAAEQHADTGHHAHHIVGLFLGGTTTEESTEFSFGAEYEYHFSKYIGAGIIAEHSVDSPHFTDGSTIALAAIYVHPWRGLRFTTAVGAEVGHGDEIHHAPVRFDSHGHEIHEESEEAGAEVLVRLGIAYDFMVTPEFAIAPTVNVDFVDGDENVVYGMVFSYHF